MWLFLNDDGKHPCWVSILFMYCFVRQWLKYSERIWRFAAREGKKVKYVSQIPRQRERS